MVCGHEVAQVVGDQAVALADAHARRLAVDHPDPEYGVVRPVHPGEVGQRGELLDDEALGAVAAGLFERPPRPPRTIVTLPPSRPHSGLRTYVPATTTAARRRSRPAAGTARAPGRRRTAATAPAAGAFVLPQHLVGRLDPRRPPGAHAVGEDRGTELVLDQPLPGIELEDDVEAAPLLVVERGRRRRRARCPRRSARPPRSRPARTVSIR